MQISRLLLATLLVFGLILAQAESRRLIFYSPRSRPLTSQLLVSRKMPRPCPAGKMRDHRDRCRRAVIFGRSN